MNLLHSSGTLLNFIFFCRSSERDGLLQHALQPLPHEHDAQLLPVQHIRLQQLRLPLQPVSRHRHDPGKVHRAVRGRLAASADDVRLDGDAQRQDRRVPAEARVRHGVGSAGRRQPIGVRLPERVELPEAADELHPAVQPTVRQPAVFQQKQGSVEGGLVLRFRAGVVPHGSVNSVDFIRDGLHQQAGGNGAHRAEKSAKETGEGQESLFHAQDRLKKLKAGQVPRGEAERFERRKRFLRVAARPDLEVFQFVELRLSRTKIRRNRLEHEQVRQFENDFEKEVSRLHRKPALKRPAARAERHAGKLEDVQEPVEESRQVRRAEEFRGLDRDQLEGEPSARDAEDRERHQKVRREREPELEFWQDERQRSVVVFIEQVHQRLRRLGRGFQGNQTVGPHTGPQAARPLKKTAKLDSDELPGEKQRQKSAQKLKAGERPACS